MRTADITPVFNYNGALNKKGEASIHLKVLLNGKRKLIGLDIHILPTQWDSKNRRVKAHPLKDVLNSRIKSEMNRVSDNEFRFIRQGRIYSIKDIVAYYDLTSTEDFIPWLEKEIEDRVDLKYQTRRQHEVFLRNLKDYSPGLKFSEINYDWLTKYERYLRSIEFTKGEVTKNLELTRVESYLKKLSTYLKRAAKLGLIQERDNPFRLFEWTDYRRANKLANQKRRYLEPSDIENIQLLQFTEENRHLERIRDFFIIQCYTGLAYSDMNSLSKDHLQYRIVNGRSGLVIKKPREKTGQSLYIPVYQISELASSLLKKYASSDKPYLFDQLKNPYINRQLKLIASLAGIKKNITTHVGRHSCAMWLLYNGIPIEFIQRNLGHSDPRSTRIYTEINERAIDNAFMRLKKG